MDNIAYLLKDLEYEFNNLLYTKLDLSYNEIGEKEI